MADAAFYKKMENAVQKGDLLFIAGERITNTSGTSSGCPSSAVMPGRRGPSLINHGSSQDRAPDGLEYPGGGPLEPCRAGGPVLVRSWHHVRFAGSGREW